ncbi:Hypothetical predicted protein [Lecanosticta acicola]|uniref:Uncharacterized protein n=1 Tax=Lecanosticta acicola TaxID=111012 RepID=A0AAI8VVF8_9PEZI|nr:Hypothetical predicted protein [Lecanosticta acicola]
MDRLCEAVAQFADQYKDEQKKIAQVCKDVAQVSEDIATIKLNVSQRVQELGELQKKADELESDFDFHDVLVQPTESEVQQLKERISRLEDLKGEVDQLQDIRSQVEQLLQERVVDKALLAQQQAYIDEMPGTAPTARRVPSALPNPSSQTCGRSDEPGSDENLYDATPKATRQRQALTTIAREATALVDSTASAAQKRTARERNSSSMVREEAAPKKSAKLQLQPQDGQRTPNTLRRCRASSDLKKQASSESVRSGSNTDMALRNAHSATLNELASSPVSQNDIHTRFPFRSQKQLKSLPRAAPARQAEISAPQAEVTASQAAASAVEPRRSERVHKPNKRYDESVDLSNSKAVRNV